jgi:polyphenol oxidase
MILPRPAASFVWVERDGRAVLVCTPLARIADHFFTTRAWLLGSGAVEPTDPAAWADVARAAAVGADRLVRVHQVHGAAVFVAEAVAAHAAPGIGGHPAADIIVGADPSHALAIQTADCVPLLIADRRTGATAAAHAGWRGLAARAPAVAVDALARTFGSRPGDLLAAIGPAIGACCYEVGCDVREQVARAGFSSDQLARWFLAAPSPTAENASLPRLMHAPRAGHWYFDGWAVAKEQLTTAGVPPEQIFVSAMCTASHPDAFCSYRRDGSPAGRMAAVIKPRPRP